jgi:hypothetical protein
MTLQIIFIVSGIMIILLIGSKVWEEKNRKSFFLLRAISKGDEHMRDFYIKSAHHYADYKEKGDFFISKQLPLHTKNFLNKSAIFLQEKSAKYLGDMRNTRILSKHEGISEFLKDISEKEKSGEINEEMMDSSDIDSQNSSNKVK